MSQPAVKSPAQVSGFRSLAYFVRTHLTFSFGLAVLTVFLLMTIFPALFTGRDPLAIDTSAFLAAPSPSHPLGTDDLGRDLLARLVGGARISLSIGVLAAAVAVALGAPLGLIAGYYRGPVDTVLSRALEAVMAFPALLLALLFIAVLGPSLQALIIFLGIAYAPSVARVTRGNVLSILHRPYIEAARSYGARGRDIMWRIVLPDMLAPLSVQASTIAALSVLGEAALSYLGLGVRPPDPAWGSMLRNSQGFLDLAPWYVLSTGTAIFLLVLSFILVSDGLRELHDPYRSRR